jgi:hypothetical protein
MICTRDLYGGPSQRLLVVTLEHLVKVLRRSFCICIGLHRHVCGLVSTPSIIIDILGFLVELIALLKTHVWSSFSIE